MCAGQSLPTKRWASRAPPTTAPVTNCLKRRRSAILKSTTRASCNAAIEMTERKKSEDEAYETATELRALFKAFPDFFLRLDREGNALDWKGGQAPDPFLSPEKFSKQNLPDILPADVIAQFLEAQDK